MLAVANHHERWSCSSGSRPGRRLARRSHSPPAHAIAVHLVFRSQAALGPTGVTAVGLLVAMRSFRLDSYVATIELMQQVGIQAKMVLSHGRVLRSLGGEWKSRPP